VRDVSALNKIVQDIADAEGRLDGLIAAAGIQQETTALDYTAEDANRMFEVNITGVFMTAQAVAKQMIRFGNGGSIVMIASMSGSIANRVCFTISPSQVWAKDEANEWVIGLDMSCVQRVQSGCYSTRTESGVGVGTVQYSRQYHLAGIYCDGNGGGAVCQVPGTKGRLANAEYAWEVVEAAGV
jgi:hypothetical protein